MGARCRRACVAPSSIEANCRDKYRVRSRSPMSTRATNKYGRATKGRHRYWSPPGSRYRLPPWGRLRARNGRGMDRDLPQAAEAAGKSTRRASQDVSRRSANPHRRREWLRRSSRRRCSAAAMVLSLASGRGIQTQTRPHLRSQGVCPHALTLVGTPVAGECLGVMTPSVEDAAEVSQIDSPLHLEVPLRRSTGCCRRSKESHGEIHHETRRAVTLVRSRRPFFHRRRRYLPMGLVQDFPGRSLATDEPGMSIRMSDGLR